MIRSEAVPMAAVAGEPQLYNCFGFTLNPNVPGDTYGALSSVPLIRANVEYADGRRAPLYLRAGQPVVSGVLMTRVWLLCSLGGALGLDVAYDEGDELLPVAPNGSEGTWQVDTWLIPAGTNLGVGVQVNTFIRPTWARRAALWSWASTALGDANISGSAGPWYAVAVPLPVGAVVAGGAAAFAELNSVQLGMATASSRLGLEASTHRATCLAVFGAGFDTPGLLDLTPAPTPERIKVAVWTAAAGAVLAGRTLPVWCEWSN